MPPQQQSFAPESSSSRVAMTLHTTVRATTTSKTMGVPRNGEEEIHSNNLSIPSQPQGEETLSAAPPRIGRSVNDYKTTDDLRQSLSYCTLGELSNTSNTTPGNGNADWMLPVRDHDARTEDIDSEVQRLWTLKSYLALDAEKEEAFDKLCDEARTHFGLPISAISLIDLGRQFAFASAGMSPEHSRNTPRNVAFCAHTILNKRDVMVVKDTREDDRFRENKLVTHPPFLRFYAGAPLVSPEGYHLGTFCVEGPDPRPEGLTVQQTKKLSEFASRTVELLVKRREKLVKKATSSPEKDEADEALRRHAGVTTNLGGLMYNMGEYVTAMKLFQESVQTLMLVEEEAPRHRPSPERQEEMSQLLTILSAETYTFESRKTCTDILKKLVGTTGETQSSQSPEETHFSALSSIIPGLYQENSNLKGTERRELAGLVFAEPFRVTVNEESDTDEHFIIPVPEGSKATLFNMGMVHYHWGNTDAAMQFFDLASSLSQRQSPLAFDPVILGSRNNMAQIHLQFRRTNDAMELLKDALARGNAALAAVYSNDNGDWQHEPKENGAARRSRRLRRKLARTVLNLGHVHFINCEYDAAMAACHDALRLLHTNKEDAEVAAAYYNIAIIHYHTGNKTESLAGLDKFVEHAKRIVGPDHLQIAEAMHRKGEILYEIGHLYDSMKPLNEGLRIRRLRLGKNHTSVAESLCLIGKVLVSREEYDFGLNAYLEGISVHRSIAGSDSLSFDVAQNLLDIGRVFQIQGNLHEAIKTYEEVIDLTKKVFGESHPFVSRLHNIVGNLCLEEGDINGSMKNFDAAVRILTENKIPFNLNVVQDPLCRVQLSHHPVAPTA